MMSSGRTRGISDLPVGFVFSQSCLQAYIDCPRSFQLRYIDRVIWPTTQGESALEIQRRQREGRLFHQLVQQHRLGLPLDFLALLVHEPNVARWWQNYLAADLGLGGYTQHVEFGLSAPIGRYRLVAKYDLLALDEGTAIIYDWKTSTARPTDECLAARWQTLVYRALLVRAGTHLNKNRPILPEHITMVYWFADFPSQPATFAYNADSYLQEWSAAEDLVTKISCAKEFLPAADEHHCHFCGYRSFCRQGEDSSLRAATDSEVYLGFD